MSQDTDRAPLSAAPSARRVRLGGARRETTDSRPELLSQVTGGDLGSRRLASASGARLAGDDYQHVFTLLHAVRLLGETFGVTRVMMEVSDTGNVDDLVVEYSERPTLYHQVKFSRVAGEPIDHTWFTDKGGATRSPLQRFYDSYLKLTVDDTPPEMALVTNRVPPPGDPVFKHLEGRDGLLVPRWAAAQDAASREVRGAWAEHLQITEDQLLAMLDHFKVMVGTGSLEQLRERCAEAMMAVGLRGDIEAVTLAHAEIRERIQRGETELDQDAMSEIVTRLALAGDQRTATLAVQGIDRLAYPDSATHTIDWVDAYEGDEPRARRRLRSEDALSEMTQDLRRAREALSAAGYSHARLGGAFRLGTAFALGAALSRTAGFELSMRQGAELWETLGDTVSAQVAVEPHEVGQGQEVAICLSISADIAEDVLAHIRAEGIPVARMLAVSPTAGASRDSVPSAAHARGLAQALLDQARSGSRDAGRLHLFQAQPNALAMMLGHIWNRVPPTLVYEDLNPGYQATFEIAA